MQYAGRKSFTAYQLRLYEQWEKGEGHNLVESMQKSHF